MNILVVSDSHGKVDKLIQAVEQTHPDYVLHLGDCQRDLEKLRQAFPMLPMEGVPGNCDYGSCDQPERLIELGGVRILMLHGHTRGVKSDVVRAVWAARECGAQVLLFGHTHRPLVAHAPYTINPCSRTEHTREFARMTLADDLKRMEYLPGNYYNFHPGSHTEQGTEVGIGQIADTLNAILKPEQHTTVLLETMSGKGSEVGGRFEELREIMDRVALGDRLGVCMDTCHISDAGYDIAGDIDGVLTEFDRVIGLHRLKAVHINDSMNPLGAHKDRHARIGEGYLGEAAFARIINHPALRDLPFILETPNDLAGYAREIARLRELRAE